MHKVELD